MIFDCRIRQLMSFSFTFSHFTRSISTSSDVFFSHENKQRVMERMRFGELRSNKQNQKTAAVLVPLVDVDGLASVLFTVRSSHLSTHRGEVSFPGGSMDESDGGSAEKAALRESEEEVGIQASSVDIWGRLTPTLTRKGDMIIEPVVGVIRGGFGVDAFNKRPLGVHEVASVFTRSLEELTDPKRFSFTQFRSGYTLPIFHADDGIRIWGLTAIILHQILRILLPDRYNPPFRYIRPLA